MGRSTPNFLVLMVDRMSGRLLDDDLIHHLHVPNLRRLVDLNEVEAGNRYPG